MVLPARMMVALIVLPMLLVGSPVAYAEPYPWDYDVALDLLSLPKNSSPAPYVTDWNGDGRDDLVVGMRSSDIHNGIAVYLRNSDGSLADPVSAFASGTASTITGFALYFRPVVGDWDGDEKNDLIFGQYYGNKGVVFCSNAGSATAPIYHANSCVQMRTTDGALVGQTTGSTVAYISPEVVDWDNDGDLDLLVGTGAEASEKGIRLYRNTGSATSPTLGEPSVIVSKASTSGLGFENYYEPDVVDINDDGAKDLLIGGGRRGATGTEFMLRECLNTGSDAEPIFASCSFKVLPGLVNNVIVSDDWDDDGYVDLLRGFFSGFITNPVTLLHGKAPDTDGDGVSDSFDNCPSVPNPPVLKLDRANPVQIDTDGDRSGDACDPDVDGDTVLDLDDTCMWTPNADQSDVDGDGRGDVCDPMDDRPGYPGIGSYEWEQANKTEWGRRPVIILRADAMSIGYRQEIAEALTLEALNRGIPFSLAVITWDENRLATSPGAAFLNAYADHPDLEVVQHGTYHSCMLSGSNSTEEFDCGMDTSQSFNLMRVGHDALTNAVDTPYAQPLSGFIPPADSFNEASVEAAQALGYRYFASAYYSEDPSLFYTADAEGMVRIPWSQIACGNGAASWTACNTTNIEARSGVDCAIEAICKPTREPVARDYTNWNDYAANSLKERCRYDLETRYGVCSILFELTSYDADFRTGALDPVAFQGYQQALTDLQALAEETNAVFMTLGQFAASRLIDDTQAPSIAINSPTNSSYGHAESLTIDFDVTDDLSGVYATEALLDGQPVRDGDSIDLLNLSLGEHVLTVRAEDTAGNTVEQQVTFTVEATIASLQGAVRALVVSGDIEEAGVATSLLQKLDAADAAIGRGNVNVARNVLDAFISEVEAQRDQRISNTAATLLITDAAAVKNGLSAR